MRDYFLFSYGGRFYRCIALPFGWGRSPLWFTQAMAPFVRALRAFGYRVLAYLDDFLLAPTPFGTPSSSRACAAARKRVAALMRSLGLRRHPHKGEWEGATRVEHLGVLVDTETLRFTVTPRKRRKVRDAAEKMLRTIRFSRRWVSHSMVSSFCGLCVSLSLAMPWARFYTRALYWDLSAHVKSVKGKLLCRLSHQSIRDLRFWRQLADAPQEGRLMLPAEPEAALHTDAADMGFGGTLNLHDLSAGAPGMWSDQGCWNWRARSRSIQLRELKAIRMTLTRRLGERLERSEIGNVKLWCDNQAVVHIVNSLVSASTELMHELRKLKLILDKLGVHIRAEWLPSAMNRYADALSRRFPSSDLKIRQQLTRSIADGMKARGAEFVRRPLGDHPVFHRLQCLRELDERWERNETRLLCPPPDLIVPTLIKLRQSRAPAVLLLPNWPRQPWFQAAMHMAKRVEYLPQTGTDAFEPHHRVNPKWGLVLPEVNLN